MCVISGDFPVSDICVRGDTVRGLAFNAVLWMRPYCEPIHPGEVLHFAASSPRASCLEVATSPALFTLQLLVPFTCLWNFKISKFWNCGGGRGAHPVATRYRLGAPEIESRWGRNFPQKSKPSLGPIQPPIKWTSAIFPGVKRPGRCVDHPPHLAPRLKKE